jgi:hypothetical protein
LRVGSPFQIARLTNSLVPESAVDGADYVLFRRNADNSYTPASYDIWRANFGTTHGMLAGGGTAAVPDACAGGLAISALLIFTMARRRLGAENS